MYNWRFHRIIIFCVIIFETEATDHCNNYKLLPDSAYRGSECPSKPYKDICDKYREPDWFRVEGDHVIVTNQVDVYMCATTYPIWMKGILPNKGTAINTTVCINQGRSGCDEEMPITIEECNGYFVYYLEPPKSCNTGYCFGSNRTCPNFEPCDFYYHDVIQNLDFNTFCSSADGWYKLQNKDQLQTECSKTSDGSIWLNVSTINNAETGDARLCFRLGSSCCERFADIQLKNCSGSLVFNMTAIRSCLCSGSCYDNTAQSATLNQIPRHVMAFVALCWSLIFLLVNH